MSTWFKLGVYGDLIPEAAEGLRITDRLYAKRGEELYVTCIREGTHGPGTFHHSGRAWDQRPGNISRNEHQAALGNKFQVIEESNHRHVEYDPPEGM